MTTARTGPARDFEALMAALVLVPQSYPRNRFYDLYRQPIARRARRRAGALRSVIADLIDGAYRVAISPWSHGYELSYSLRDPASARRSRLSPRELALVAAIVRRARAAVAAPLAAAVGEPAIAELTPVLARLLGE